MSVLGSARVGLRDDVGQIVVGERVAAAEHDRALDDVLELAHVARPRVVERAAASTSRGAVEARRGRSSRSRRRGSDRRAAGCPRGARAAAAR